jgi:hypothetical protein
MMVKREALPMTLALLLVSSVSCSSLSSRAVGAPKQSDVILGTVTHYDWFVSMACLTSSPCGQEMLAMIQGNSGPQPVKLVYTYHLPADDLSKTVLAHVGVWAIRAKRDVSCDEAMLSRGDRLRTIGGAQASSVSDAVLPCYRFGPGDYESRGPGSLTEKTSN